MLQSAAATTTDHDRRREVALQVPLRRAPPRDDRPDAHQREEREPDREVHALEERRPHADLLTRHALGDEREQGAPHDRECRADQQQVVEQEGRLTRQERLDLVVARSCGRR
jgi:hypothetical protein